ncbi:MAG: hypothetical protein SH807_02030 [Blastochloris sp.]|jgi:hypothetical protein|nr:hypothetical protein [Blastochloris sp.]
MKKSSASPDKSFIKVLDLITKHTEQALKALKNGDHEKSADAIDMIGELADTFLFNLETEAAAKAKPVVKAKSKAKKAATKKVVKAKK